MLLKYYNHRSCSIIGRTLHQGFHASDIACDRLRFNHLGTIDKLPVSETDYTLNIAPIFFMEKLIKTQKYSGFINYYSNYISKETCRDYLNNTHQIFTCSHQNDLALKEAGFKRPIHKISPPIRLSFFDQTPTIKPLKHHRDRFYFAAFCNLDPVQGLDILLDSYIQEFDYNDPVTLILRCDQNNVLEPKLNLNYWINEVIKINNKLNPPDIWVIDKPIIDQRQIYKVADAVISCARYECVGLSIIEALASHCKVLAPLHSSFQDYTTEINQCGYKLGYEELGGRYVCDGSPGPFDLVKVSLGGTWYECDIDHVKIQMRKAVDDWKLSESYRTKVDLSRFCHYKQSKHVWNLMQCL